jgi:hypothetical protein
VTITSVVAAAIAGLVSTRAGLTAEMLFIFYDIVALVNFTFTIRTGTFGVSGITHSANT